MHAHTPQAYFDAARYLARNPDLFAAGLNTPAAAWDHYQRHGAAESLAGAASRSPAPWFDAAWYLAQHPDLAAAGLAPADLFVHFVLWGIAEGRAPAAGFHATLDELAAYAAANADLRHAFGIHDPARLSPAQHEALARHLYQYGYAEGRDAVPFDRPPPADPHRFQLSERIETLRGTDADDLFLAPTLWADGVQVDTLQPGDVLLGGGGHDTLLLESLGGTIPLRMDGIEHLRLTAHYLTSLEAAYAHGLRAVTVEQSAGAVAVRHLEQLVQLTVRDQVGVRDPAFGANHIGLTYGGQALEGHSVQAIVLDHARLQPGGAWLYFDALAGTLDALDITVTGASSLAGIGGAPDPAAWGADYADLAGLGTVRVHARAALDLGLLAAPDLLRFDASGSSAGVTVDLSRVDGASLRVRGGAGDDVFVIDPAAHAGQVLHLSLGGGRDTLRIRGGVEGRDLSFHEDPDGSLRLGWDEGAGIRLLAVIDDLALDRVADALSIV
ncbi:hypothetical protein [Castellaniella defragrans]|uniref:Uncharacterized protein n=1 Tax=Castellaniella defragrans TaxID=75697 RepID=A0A7W9TNW6_CASDE|nr:hypothetical protein [Castellaniella defragrans]KAB0608391.1 hypothetical protein F7Q88_13045 [Castellaniella defragrans]MBB6084099.1 hypothetical protein [Castellaniella defragrans]